MKYIDKKYQILVISVLLFVGCATVIAKRMHGKTNFESSIVSQDGKPVNQLVALLKMFNLRSDSLENIISDTQAQWLRKPNEERWQQEERFEDQKDVLLPIFTDIGLVNQVEPKKKHYTYALVLGGNVHGFRERLGYLKKLAESGISFDSIILLGGQRVLDSQVESKEQLLHSENTDLPIRKNWRLIGDLPTTEMAMMEMVVDQSDLSEELKAKMTSIDTPMQIAADGTKRRPNTADTILSWLETNPARGSTLWISSQPHILYQDSVIKTYMPESGFEIETVGPELGEIKIATMFDALARVIYQENKRLQQSKS